MLPLCAELLPHPLCTASLLTNQRLVARFDHDDKVTLIETMRCSRRRKRSAERTIQRQTRCLKERPVLIRLMVAAAMPRMARIRLLEVHE